MIEPIQIREVHHLLEQQLPRTALQRLGRDAGHEAACLAAEAWMMLDQMKMARQILEEVITQLKGDWGAYARRLWSEIQLTFGAVDEAILAAKEAAEMAGQSGQRAEALAWAGVGYGKKQCWGLAKKMMDEAAKEAVGNVTVQAAKARLLLIMDRRLEAREAYVQLGRLKSARAQMISGVGQANVAWLLGELSQAETLARKTLQISNELIQPLFISGDIALANEDQSALAKVVQEMRLRSPGAEILETWIRELENLRRLDGAKRRMRLKILPLAVQRRDHCAPCTIEVVLRYWKEGLDYSNDQIARAVKYAEGGSPVYRMREFFHLTGFETVRCFANESQLPRLVDAGFPVIIQEAYSESAHVSVVVGYDEERHVIEVQDPVSHIIRAVSPGELGRLRHNSGESALMAFPRGQGHELRLAKMGFVDDPILESLDRCGLALDEGRLQLASELAARALVRHPKLELAWMMRLAAEQACVQQLEAGLQEGMHPGSARENRREAAQAHLRFRRLLKEAHRFIPEASFLFAFEGAEAYREGNLERAKVAYLRALELDPNDAATQANLAACYAANREVEACIVHAGQGLKINSAQTGANAWMARALAASGDSRAIHYGECAVELDATWWLAHLALGEAYLAGIENSPENLDLARREAEEAFSLGGEQAETRLLQARLHAQADQPEASMAILEELAWGPMKKFPAVAYEMRRTMCFLHIAEQEYEQADRQIEEILRQFPGDGWAVTQRVLIHGRVFVAKERYRDEQAVEAFRQSFEQAIHVNEGAVDLVEEYLNHLASWMGSGEVAREAQRLVNEYPNQAGLNFLAGRWLARGGEEEEGSRYMAKAISYPDGLRIAEELGEAMGVMASGMDLTEGEAVVRVCAAQKGRFTPRELWKAWGLALAELSEPKACIMNRPAAKTRAVELLEDALQQDDEDSLVTLRLGMLSEDKETQEELLRRAVLLAPHWAYARAELVNYLLADNRALEALRFSAGYEEVSDDLRLVHALALLRSGWFEPAASHFERYIQETGTNDPEIMVEYWNALNGSGDVEKALGLYRKLIKNAAGRGDWHLRLAQTWMRMERYDQAEEALTGAEARGAEPKAVLAGVYEVEAAQGNWEMAFQAADQLCGLDDAAAEINGTARRLRAWVELGDLGAIREWMETANLSSQSWAACAWAAMAAEDGMERSAIADLCLEFCNRAFEGDPQSFHARYARALALVQLGKETEGWREIEILGGEYPRQHLVYSMRAMKYLSEQRLEEGLDLAERAVEYGAGDAFSFAVRGMAFVLWGDAEKGLADLSLAWKRAYPQQRRSGKLFWWLLGMLAGEDEKRLEELRRGAAAPTQSRVNRKILKLLEDYFTQGQKGEGVQ